MMWEPRADYSMRNFQHVDSTRPMMKSQEYQKELKRVQERSKKIDLYLNWFWISLILVVVFLVILGAISENSTEKIKIENGKMFVFYSYLACYSFLPTFHLSSWLFNISKVKYLKYKNKDSEKNYTIEEFIKRCKSKLSESSVDNCQKKDLTKFDDWI